MCGPDLLARVEVGDGARHAQDAVVAASGQAQPLKRAAHELLARLVERAVLPDHRRRHIGVAAHARPLEALLLDGACGVDPRADHGRGLRLFPAAHGVVFDGGNGDVHVDPVEQRAGDAVQVALHLLFRAGAAPVGVAVPPAAAGVHGADEQKAARQRQAPRGARDRHDAVLERLAQRLHGGLVELRQLVEKQHTRLTARKKSFSVCYFPKIYVSFTYPIPLPYGGENIGVNTPLMRVGEAVSSI